MTTRALIAIRPLLPEKGYIFALLVVTIWTGFILISRAGGIGQLTAWDLIAIRYGTSGLVVLPLWLLVARTKLWDRRIVVLGLFGGVAYGCLAFAGFKLTTAAHAAVLLPGLMPFFVALTANLLLKEKLSERQKVGLLVIGIGVSCLAMDVFDAGGGHLWGDLLMISASICWSIYSVLVRRWAVAPWAATCGVTLVTCIAFLPIYVVALPKHIMSASWQELALQAVYQGVIASTIQMVLYVRTVALIGPTRLGTMMALIPALAGVAAVPVLNEPLTAWVMAGLVFVCVGAWWSNRAKRG
jgi:drug/metabolite transporter (DMT)-like permease